MSEDTALLKQIRSLPAVTLVTIEIAVNAELQRRAEKQQALQDEAFAARMFP